MFKIKIFPKILFALLIVSAIPFAGIWYQNQQNNRINEQLILEKMKFQSESVRNYISSWAETNRLALSQNSLDADMRSLSTQKQKPLLENILKTYDWSYLVYTVGADGFKTARSDNKAIIKEDGTKAHFRGDREYFVEVKNGGEIGQQVVISRTINGPAYVLCVPFVKPGVPNSQKNRNALCMASELNSIAEQIIETRFGNTGSAILVDDQNNLIADGSKLVDPNEELKLLNRGDHPVIAGDTYGELVSFKEDGKDRVGYMLDAGFGWKLILQQDFDETYAMRLLSQSNTLKLAAIAAFFTFLVAVFAGRSISEPIRQISQSVVQYSKGKFNTSLVGLERKDEVGDLARSVKLMSTSLEIAINRLIKSKSQ